MQILRFKITNKRDKKNYKVLEVPATINLYRFAEIIVKSIGFDFDHCFEFNSNLDNPYTKPDEVYQLFVDICEESQEGAKSTKKFYVIDAFTKKGKQMLFLFDYGDGWEFIVECIEDSEIVLQVPRNYYKIIESHGDDPEQYPDYDDE